MKLTPNYTEKSTSQSSFFDYKTPRALSPGPSVARTPSNKESKKPDIPLILVGFHSRRLQLFSTNNAVTSLTSEAKETFKSEWSYLRRCLYWWIRRERFLIFSSATLGASTKLCDAPLGAPRHYSSHSGAATTIAFLLEFGIVNVRLIFLYHIKIV